LWGASLPGVIDSTSVGGQARADTAVRGTSGREETPQQQVRRANERRVFHLIRRGEALSRVGLVRATGLSAQSIGDIIRVLLEQRLIEETGAKPQRGLGRHPIGVRIRPRGALAFGCNIERDRVDGAWIDLSGAVVVSQSVRYEQGEEPRRTIGRIEALFESLNARLTAADGPRLPVIGLAMPGPIDPESHRLVNPPNFAHWDGVDPRALFSAGWQLPVHIENAATAAAIGEAWQSRSVLTNFLYCHWGVGVGGGLVLDLETYRGTTGNALELGHLPVVPAGATCGCGGRGCLEAEASVAAVCRQASQLGFHGSFGDLVERAPREPSLAALLERAGQLLGQALVGAVNLFDVDAVVLGGHHLLQAAQWLVPPVKQALAEWPIARDVRPVAVLCSELGETAGAVGAASAVLDRLLPSSTEAGTAYASARRGQA
jgi:predicted NBD/HSP70 family sugar kinase